MSGVIDFTYLHKRGLLNVKEEKSSGPSAEVVDLTNPVEKIPDKPLESVPSLDFFDSVVRVDKPTYGVGTNSGVESKIDDLHRKLDDLLFRLGRIEERMGFQNI